MRPSFARRFLALRREGAGKTGCALHPRSRVQLCMEMRTRAYSCSGGIRPSLRNGFTAYGGLSPATSSCCHRHGRIKGLSSPVGPTRLRQFDISNGCQDHTLLPYASAPFVSRAADRSRAFRQPALRSRCAPDAVASTASHPTFVTMANAPLSRTGSTGYNRDEGRCEAVYF
jgi:hypothetical protein